MLLSESDRLTNQLKNQWGRTWKNMNQQGRILTRNEVAKLVHEFIRDVLVEPDEPDINEAMILKDLFDCGNCVQHIAQVYLKGIMTAAVDLEFRGNTLIDRDSLDMIDFKMTERINRRISGDAPECGDCSSGDVPGLDDFLCEHRSKDYLIIDVREKYAFEVEHLPDSINIPISEYALNPHLAGNDICRNLIFVCEMGHTARIAAEYAKSAGYKNVSVCKLKI